MTSNRSPRTAAVRRFARAAAAILVVVAASALSGCGLLLDAWPPDPLLEAEDAAMNGCVGGDCPDSGGGELDAGRERDTGILGDDADPSDLDGGGDASDAGANLDATVLVDGSSREAGVSIEAGVSSDAGSFLDARPRDGGRIDAGGFVCENVHPIIGPPRTCELGSCLCTFVDACFTSDVVRACCADDFVCAPALSECMGTHPIIGGATRTCERGSCYCGNPDACFPADRADSCCGVDVVCVL